MSALRFLIIFVLDSILRNRFESFLHNEKLVIGKRRNHFSFPQKLSDRLRRRGKFVLRSGELFENRNQKFTRFRQSLAITGASAHNRFAQIRGQFFPFADLEMRKIFKFPPIVASQNLVELFL